MTDVSPGTLGAVVLRNHRCLVTYLIKVNHDIAFKASAALHILQGQREVDTTCVWDVQVVRVILVPFLDGRKHLVLICANDMHVLKKKHRKWREDKCYPLTWHVSKKGWWRGRDRECFLSWIWKMAMSVNHLFSMSLGDYALRAWWNEIEGCIVPSL